MTGRSLRASFNDTELGTLQEVAGLWSFQYSPDGLKPLKVLQHIHFAGVSTGPRVAFGR
jgi:hypothetical protein